MKKTYLFSYALIALLLMAGTSNAQMLIKTIAGTGVAGYNGDGIAATDAELKAPINVALDDSGNVYIADIYTYCIRKISAATGLISTIAGIPLTSSVSASNNVPATSAPLDQPWGIAVDHSGNVYFSDAVQLVVYKITAATGMLNIVAGTDTSITYNGDNIAATAANINPAGIALDDSGNIYIATGSNSRIRKVSAATGLISTIAGTGVPGYNGDGILADTAQISSGALFICLDDSGNVYFSDQNNHRVRKISAATGLISTVAGTGAFAFYNGDSVLATLAPMLPEGVAIDHAGNLYISTASRIGRVDAITGFISTVAGSGGTTYNGDGIPANTANIFVVTGVAVDDTDNVYLAQGAVGGSPLVRKVYLPCDSVVTGTINLTGATAACDSTADSLALPGASRGDGVSYQWQSSTDGINWTNVNTTTAYATGTLTTTTYYRAVVGCNYSGASDSTGVDTIHVHPSPVPVITANNNVLSAGSYASYQWMMNGVDIPGATSGSYTLTQNDTFSVTVTDSNGCSGTSLVYVETGLGVADIHNANMLRIYPNPATGVIYIDAPVAVSADISAIDGRVVLHRENAKAIDISSLANGMYLITVYDKDKSKLKTEKLVKE